ncbi:hypothetical protein SKAU_G00145380 [Synaphobranchus kaupii]|uniref:Uncharacterized protein n=1 Tax=Synaphobranchus kaupii TaxID=118154 RepID=A0A9Q1FT72_SYNKA|nr:hypothetical protein SKAU_G00145380 [Synaphobranchus kaupii]
MPRCFERENAALSLRVPSGCDSPSNQAALFTAAGLQRAWRRRPASHCPPPQSSGTLQRGFRGQMRSGEGEPPRGRKNRGPRSETVRLFVRAARERPHTAAPPASSQILSV